jgi:hypothetical protein
MLETLPTTTPTPASPSDPAASRDLQRRSLEHIVSLATTCSAEEQRLDQQHADALARENAAFNAQIHSFEERRRSRREELAATYKQRKHAIQSRYDTQRQELDSTSEKSRFLLTRQKDDAESALKKQVEQTCWQAETLFVQTQMKVDVDAQQWKKEEEKSDADLAALALLEDSAHKALERYRIDPAPADAPIAEPLQQRLAADRLAVLAEYRERALAHLQQLQAATQPNILEDLAPLLIVLVLATVSGGIAWFVTSNPEQKVLFAALAAAAIFLLGIVVWLIRRQARTKRIRTQAKALYLPFREAYAVAVAAARVDSDAAAAARDRRVTESRHKRDHETAIAREKGRLLLAQTSELYRNLAADENDRYTSQLAALDQEKKLGLSELKTHRETTTRQIEDEFATARHEAQSRHDLALSQIESDYAAQCQSLNARWNDGLRAAAELMALGSGIDPQLIDWNNPAWQHWRSPAPSTDGAPSQVRFGEMKVDLAQLTEQLPKRLQLPDSFAVPAMLGLPSHASLLIETDHTGRSAAIDAAQMVMARLLTQLPAGRVRFTIFDPVGLGQSFAGFMHLADHDEALVGSRIWTERDHMLQRLADLTEHMETIIQKYLRNEYATIDEYNAQAGELAEPVRFLVIADFPIGFDQDSLRRLASIANTGPRCGVYTIILRDTRQPLPPGSRIEDLISRAVYLQYKNGAFIWNDAVFKRFPLRLDPPPSEDTLTRLMDLVGKAAKDAKRVEVPFASIAPPTNQFWSLSSQNDLRVPLGKSGATRLQSLKLGHGVAQHVLVAGKTGSGKSNLMHTIVTNLAMWYGPDEVEFYLVDFKKGVEFKAYASSQLPHARAIAVESDREFGLSVLQRVDAELSRRGTLFRDAGVQEISAYRQRTGQKLPRTVLLIDEFQEFFAEDDKLSGEASGLLDRLVRQGRAFGVHVVLGSQTIGGTSGLARSTLGQIAVRIALQCTEADSQLILGDNNSAARLLSRPGEAVYNDAGGLVEANSPFQIAFLPDEHRTAFLEQVRALAQSKSLAPPTPVVFEGNSAADIRTNKRLLALLESPTYPPPASSVPAFVGEPVAIKEPTAIPFRRQSGANVLMVGHDEESAVAIFASLISSLAAQQTPADATFYLMDGTPADAPTFGLLERVLATIPHPVNIVAWRAVPEAINDLATLLKSRQADDSNPARTAGVPPAAGASNPSNTDSSSLQNSAFQPESEQMRLPAAYLFLFGLQRYRLLRKQEDDFSFSRSEEPAAPKPDKQFAELLSEGPALGIHTIIWADTPITLDRTLDRSAMRQFDHRILFQMSANDSNNLIDSPLANRLGSHRALLYSEEQGTIEKFRPYQLPSPPWLDFLSTHKLRAAARS